MKLAINQMFATEGWQSVAPDSDMFKIYQEMLIDAPLDWVWERWPEAFNVTQIYYEVGSYVSYHTARGIMMNQTVVLKDNATHHFQYRYPGDAHVFEKMQADQVWEVYGNGSKLKWTYWLEPLGTVEAKTAALKFKRIIYEPYLRYSGQRMKRAIEQKYRAEEDEIFKVTREIVAPADPDSEIFKVSQEIVVNVPLDWVWDKWPKAFNMSKTMWWEDRKFGVLSAQASPGYNEPGSHVRYVTSENITVDEEVITRDNATHHFRYESPGDGHVFQKHQGDQIWEALGSISMLTWTYWMEPLPNEDAKIKAYLYKTEVYEPYLHVCGENIKNAIEKEFTSQETPFV